MRQAFAAWAVAWMACSLSAAAQAPAPIAPVLTGAKAWHQLSATQREVLAPLAPEWAEIPPASQQKWLQVAARYAQLTPDEQGRVHQRMQDWAHLSPKERLRARIGWQDAQRIDPAERRAKWERYQSLPPEARQALQDRAAQRQGPAAQRPMHQVGAAVSMLTVRASHGATTVPITQKPGRPVLHTRPLSLAGLDPRTLLPLPPAPPANPASQP